MIKSVWNAVAIIAVVNLLLIGSGVGYLVATDRLDMDRLGDAKEIFTETRVEQEIREAQKQILAEDVALVEAQEERDARDPVTSEVKVMHEFAMEDRDRARIERLREDLRAPLEDLARREDDLARREEEFAATVKRFQERTARQDAENRDEKFQLAVKSLSGQPPNHAKEILDELIDATEEGGDVRVDQEGFDQAVRYLEAMPARNRTKVLGVFEPPMAQRLIERMRTRGTE